MKWTLAILVFLTFSTQSLWAKSRCEQVFNSTPDLVLMTQSLFKGGEAPKGQRALIRELRSKGFSFEWAEKALSDKLIQTIFRNNEQYDAWLNFKPFKAFVFARVSGLYRSETPMELDKLASILVYYHINSGKLSTKLDMQLVLKVASVNPLPLAEGKGTLFGKIIDRAEKIAANDPVYKDPVFGISEYTRLNIKDLLETFKEEIEKIEG